MDKRTFCEGRYETFQEIRGHTNTIYFAYDKEAQIPVAIKLMKDRNNSSLAKLEQETRIWVDINFTPYIVNLLSVEKINEAPALVMEWINNGYGEKSDLRTWSEQQKRYPFDTVLKFALQFCFAMMECIQKHIGFAHRDIKPENILVDCDNNIKICDISISNGTEGYVAPEIEAGNNFSELTDIYSFGRTFLILFNDCLYGDSIYIAETKTIIEKCCDEDPTLRLCSFQEIYFQLQSVCYKYNGVNFTPETDISGNMEQAIHKSLALAQLEYHQQALDTLTEATRHVLIKGYQVKTLYYSPSVLFNIANAYYNLEQYKDALAYIDMALNITQDEYRLWDLKAHILYFYKKEDYPLEEVMECLERTFQLCPQDITAYQLKSRILLDNEKFRESISALKDILNIEPNNKEAIRRMAINYRYLELWDKAVFYYNKLLLINPDNRVTIIKDIVACHMENNNLERAQNALVPLYRENPNDYSVSWLQANIWLRVGNSEDAYIELYKDRILLETEIAFNDKNDVAFEILSSVCSMLFDFNNAKKNIKRAYDLKPNKQRRVKMEFIFKNCDFVDKIHDFFEGCHGTIIDNAIDEYDYMLASLKEYIQMYSRYNQDNLVVQYMLMNLYFYISCIYFQREQYQEALAAIVQAQQRFPIQPFYLINKARLLYINGYYKNALSCIEYGEKTDSCAQFYSELEEIKVQILKEHPDLKE